MRIGLFFLISGFIQPAMAITKCEINGVVSYKQGPCPVNASSKYLINDKYVSEKQLRKKKQERQRKSDEDFIKISPSRQSKPVISNSSKIEDQQAKPQQLSGANEAIESSDRETVEQNHKADTKAVPHVNVPGAFDYVNPKLEKMNRKLEEHDKKLQQLQNAE